MSLHLRLSAAASASDQLACLFGPDSPFAPGAGPALAEHWKAAGVRVVDAPGLQLRCGTEYLFATVQLPQAPDMRAAAADAYARVRAAMQAHGYPHWLRTWNFFDRINQGQGDQERYREFCVGRAEALGALSGPLPAATVIGTQQPGFWLWVLAGRNAGVAIENPRQTPAWRYPRDYGPQSPRFTRALWLPAPKLLLVSGTAAVVGHATRHPGDARAQLDETWENLQSLLAEARQQSGARTLSAIAHRLYVRDAAALPELHASWQARAAIPVAGVQGDICRADLMLEVEAVYGAD
jgi:chorismate lyase / 3-hydroxybenzoate synthase